MVPRHDRVEEHGVPGDDVEPQHEDDEQQCATRKRHHVGAVLRDGRRLGRVGFVILGGRLEPDLHAADFDARGVEIVDGKLGAVPNIDAGARLRPGDPHVNP